MVRKNRYESSPETLERQKANREIIRAIPKGKLVSILDLGGFLSAVNDDANRRIDGTITDSSKEDQYTITESNGKSHTYWYGNLQDVRETTSVNETSA